MSQDPTTRPSRAAAFLSSGDLLADRRYEWAMRVRREGDLAAAADLLQQAVGKAPGFASAWFALGETREDLGEREAAVEAFRQALAVEPSDRLGAALRLARLGAADAASAMSAEYVRALFDQYAPTFDDALVGRLGYRAPALLLRAVGEACHAAGRPFRFERALDLGCGTGLAGQVSKPHVGTLAGVDLSPAMVDHARQSGVYDDLRTGDMLGFLQAEPPASADLVLAADVLVYVAELGPIFGQARRVLGDGGLFAFTLEAHDGEGVLLRETLRYAHGERYVRTALADAGLRLLSLEAASTRDEKREPVPGWLVVAAR